MRMAVNALALLLMAGMAQHSAQAASADVVLKGSLVAEPCTVTAGSDGDNVVVDFGTIAEKTFYSLKSRRTWLQPFHILLKECDLSLGKTVKITFTGTEDPEQSGLLAVKGNNGVAHVAVGLQTPDGQAFDFNQQSDVYMLQSGITQLDFKAYLQASDEGVRTESVGRGVFEAVSTFELEYP